MSLNGQISLFCSFMQPKSLMREMPQHPKRLVLAALLALSPYALTLAAPLLLVGSLTITYLALNTALFPLAVLVSYAALSAFVFVPDARLGILKELEKNQLGHDITFHMLSRMSPEELYQARRVPHFFQTIEATPSLKAALLIHMQVKKAQQLLLKDRGSASEGNFLLRAIYDNSTTGALKAITKTMGRGCYDDVCRCCPVLMAAIKEILAHLSPTEKMRFFGKMGWFERAHEVFEKELEKGSFNSTDSEGISHQNHEKHLRVFIDARCYLDYPKELEGLLDDAIKEARSQTTWRAQVMGLLNIIANLSCIMDRCERRETLALEVCEIILEAAPVQRSEIPEGLIAWLLDCGLSLEKHKELLSVLPRVGYMYEQVQLAKLEKRAGKDPEEIASSLQEIAERYWKGNYNRFNFASEMIQAGLFMELDILMRKEIKRSDGSSLSWWNMWCPPPVVGAPDRSLADYNRYHRKIDGALMLHWSGSFTEAYEVLKGMGSTLLMNRSGGPIEIERLLPIYRDAGHLDEGIALFKKRMNRDGHYYTQPHEALKYCKAALRFAETKEQCARIQSWYDERTYMGIERLQYDHHKRDLYEQLRVRLVELEQEV